MGLWTKPAVLQLALHYLLFLEMAKTISMIYRLTVRRRTKASVLSLHTAVICTVRST